MLFRFLLMVALSLTIGHGHAGDASSLFCQEMPRRLPNVSRNLCERAQLTSSEGRSVQRRTLMARYIPADKANLRVLVLGGIHGDELSSVSLALHWLLHAETPPADAVHRVHWRFIPALNPDGIMAARPTRTNASGVDLNRNFPTPGWAKEAPVYWEKRTRRDPRRWPGKAALSEPESRFLDEQIKTFKPQLILSIHAPYGVLDFDGPFTPPKRLGRLYLDQVGIFPGSLGNYGGVHLRIPVVTVELPSALRTPLDSEMRQMWLDLLRWMAERVPAGGTRRLGPRLPDSAQPD